MWINIKDELPAYNKEVVMAYIDPDTQEVKSGSGFRTFTDHNGEHYDFIDENRGAPMIDTRRSVLAWFDVPEIPIEFTL